LMARAGVMLEKNVEDLDAFKQHELASHRELYQIFRQGNAEQSRQAMIDHIAYSEKLIVHAFDSAMLEPTPSD